MVCNETGLALIMLLNNEGPEELDTVDMKQKY
jgi:hypothetical protein